MIIKQGQLLKRSSGKMMKQWHKRTFFLRTDGVITYDSEKKTTVMYLSRCTLEPSSLQDISKQGDVYVFIIKDRENTTTRLKLGSKTHKIVRSWYLAVKQMIDSDARPWNTLWNLRDTRWDSDTIWTRLQLLRDEHMIQSQFVYRARKIVESTFHSKTKTSSCPEWFKSRNSPIPSRGRHVRVENILINFADNPQHAKQLKQEVRNVTNLRYVLRSICGNDDIVCTPLVCLVEIMGITALVMAHINNLSMKNVVSRVLENDRWHFSSSKNEEKETYVSCTDVNISKIINQLGLEPAHQGDVVAIPSLVFIRSSSSDHEITYAIGGALLCPPILSDSYHRMMLIPSESDRSFEILDVSPDFSELKALLGSSTVQNIPINSKIEGSEDRIVFFDKSCKNVENCSLRVLLDAHSKHDVSNRGDVVLMPRRFVAGHVASEERFRPEFISKKKLCLAIPPPFHRTNDSRETSRYDLSLAARDASSAQALLQKLSGVSFVQQIVETCHDFGIPLKLALPRLLRESSMGTLLEHLVRAEILCRSASKVLDNRLREQKDVMTFANSFLLGFSRAPPKTIKIFKDATSFSKDCLSKAFGEHEGEMLHEFWCVKLQVELLMGTFGMTGKLHFTSEEKNHLRNLGYSLRREQVLEPFLRCCPEIELRPSSIRRLWENESCILKASDFIKGSLSCSSSRSKDMNIRIRHIVKECSSLYVRFQESSSSSSSSSNDEEKKKHTMSRMLCEVFGDGTEDEYNNKKKVKEENTAEEFDLMVTIEKLDDALKTQNLDIAKHATSRYKYENIPIVFEIVICVLEIMTSRPTKQKLEHVLSRLQDLIVSPVPRLQPERRRRRRQDPINLSVAEATNDVMRGAHDLTIQLLKLVRPESIEEFDELLDEILAVAGKRGDSKIDIIESTRNLLRYSRWISTSHSALVRRSSCSILSALPPDRGQLYVQGSVKGLSLEEEQRLIEQKTHDNEKEQKTKRFVICEPIFGVSGMLAAKVRCGYRHVAVIDAFKRLWTFGHGECGRLGHGNELSVERPKLVRAFADHFVQDVDCGREHTIAVTNNGMYTWGWGEAGRLGLRDEATRLVPTKVPIRRNDVHGGVLKVAAGREHSFCITANGFLYAWGAGSLHCLGNGFDDDLLRPRMVRHGDIKDQFIVYADGGEGHSCALTNSGGLLTWGFGESGALGYEVNKEDPFQKLPRFVKDLPHIIAVSCGSYHTAAVDASGVVYMFGDNANGQLGVKKEMSSSNVPVPVYLPLKSSEGEIVVEIGCGVWNTIALTSRGRVWMWGKCGEGAVPSDRERVPNIVSSLSHRYIASLSVGRYMIVASSLPDISSSSSFSTRLRVMHTEKPIRCRRRHVGNRHVIMFGTCGSDISAPRRVPQLAGKNVTTMCAGDGFTIVSTECGRTYAWGNDSAGQCCQGGDRLMWSTPIVVDFMTGLDVVSLSCSRTSVLAITKDGQAFTWGRHDDDDADDDKRDDEKRTQQQQQQQQIHSKFKLAACTDNGAILTSSRRKQCFVLGDLMFYQISESSEKSKERQTKIRLLWVEIRMLSAYRDTLRREYAEAEVDVDSDETLKRVLHRRIDLLRSTIRCLRKAASGDEDAFEDIGKRKMLQLRFREVSNARDSKHTSHRPRRDSHEDESSNRDDVRTILNELRSKLGVSSNRSTPIKEDIITSRTPSPSMMMRGRSSKRRSRKLSKDSVDAVVDVAATAVSSTSRRRAVSDGNKSTNFFFSLRRRPSAQFQTSLSGEGMSVSFDLDDVEEEQEEKHDDDEEEEEEDENKMDALFLDMNGEDDEEDKDDEDDMDDEEVYLNVIPKHKPLVRAVPKRIFGRRKLAKISCGSRHCVALTRYGEALSWGFGPNGSLGTGLLEHPKMIMPPRRIATIRGCCMLSSAGEHNMVVTTKGTIYVWGRNDSGQLGTGDRLNRHSPKLLDIEFTLRILDIACGRSHSVVAFDLGTLYVFGSNKFGQCGLHKDKKMSDILKPQKIELSSQDWAAQSSSKKTRIDIKQVVAGFTQTVLAVSCTRV